MKKKSSHLIIAIVIIVIGNNACNKSPECTSQNNLRNEFSLPKSLSDITGQLRSITLSKKSFSSFNNQLVSPEIADSALSIASRIFSSPEFQNNMSGLDFMYENHCVSCGENATHRSERITGKEVLDSLFKLPAVSLKLIVEQGRCSGALGSTCPKSDQINSNYKAIQCDMSNLPFKYAYAVHLCHEYMHIVGYCHTDHKDDVAEKAGWVAYYIVLDWVKK